MMEWTRGPSRIVTALIFSAASSILYLVFRTHDREAAVPSGPCGPEACAGSAEEGGQLIGLLGAPGIKDPRRGSLIP